jgi:hypothetical protein
MEETVKGGGSMPEGETNGERTSVLEFAMRLARRSGDRVAVPCATGRLIPLSPLRTSCFSSLKILLESRRPRGSCSWRKRPRVVSAKVFPLWKMRSGTCPEYLFIRSLGNVKNDEVAQRNKQSAGPSLNNKARNRWERNTFKENVDEMGAMGSKACTLEYGNALSPGAWVRGRPICGRKKIARKGSFGLGSFGKMGVMKDLGSIFCFYLMLGINCVVGQVEEKKLQSKKNPWRLSFNGFLVGW